MPGIHGRIRLGDLHPRSRGAQTRREVILQRRLITRERARHMCGRVKTDQRPQQLHQLVLAFGDALADTALELLAHARRILPEGLERWGNTITSGHLLAIGTLALTGTIQHGGLLRRPG